MNGDTHNFYGVIFGTVIITLLSGFNEAFGKAVWLGLLTNIAAMMIYGWATIIDNNEAKKEKATKGTEKEHKTHELVDKGISKAKKLAFIMLYANVVIVCVVASFNNTQWFGWNISAAVISVGMVIFGAELPDFDTKILGIEAHRNPLTHSWVIPTILWTLGMVAFPFGDITLIYIGMFCIGYASHLMLDTIPSTAGFFEGIKEFFAFHHAPGDIRGVPENWEHVWLFSGAVGLFAEFATTVTRFYGTHGFDYDTSGDWNTPTITIAIIGWVAVGLWAVLLVLGHFVDKKKPSPRTKQGYSKRYTIPKNVTCDTNDPIKATKTDEVVKSPITVTPTAEQVSSKKSRKKSSSS